MSSMSGPLTCVLVLVGVGLHFAPENVVAQVRAVVADALRPGQVAAREVTEFVRGNSNKGPTKSDRAHRTEVDRLRDQLQAEQTRTASLQIQLAQRADLNSRTDSLPETIRTLPPLVTSSLIDAAVLGDAVAEKWRKGKLLDRGQTSGVRETELVVKSNHALVDVGRDGDLSPEDGVLLGRCVIGKVERVGRWTSTFLLLTDSGYRGRAQLVHQAGSGYVFGAKGILEGQGEPLCRLKGIASSDSVTVGDAVYAATREGLSSTPLYYGRVVEASLGPSDSEWKVLVEPVPVPSDLQSVQIMRTAVNNERLTAER